MFSSVRARLTLWYTGMLALTLVAFALAGYVFLSVTLNRRTDEALAEMANAFASTLADEASYSHQGEANAAKTANGDDVSSNPAEAVIEAVRQNQFRDYQLVVYGDGGAELARRPVQKKVQKREKGCDWTPPPGGSESGGMPGALHPAPNLNLYF